MIKVSIIIPVYNVASYLDKCLSSCVNQTFREIEIIVVNDASPDSSLDIIEAYAVRDKRIVVINKEQNEGLIYARKSGLEIARSEYIFHLDGDDYISETAIEYLYREVILHDTDMVIGDYCVLKNNRIDRYGYFDINQGVTGQALLYELISTFGWAIWGKLMRKTLYNDLIYKPISRGEDLFQIMQIIPKVQTVAIVHSCVYYQIYRAESLTNSKDIISSIQHIQLAESIYSLMDNYAYDKKVKDQITIFLLRLLCYSIPQDSKRAKLIVKRKFLRNPEFRRLCWREYKKNYLKCCLYLFSPRLSQIVFHIFNKYRSNG